MRLRSWFAKVKAVFDIFNFTIKNTKAVIIPIGRCKYTKTRTNLNSNSCVCETIPQLPWRFRWAVLFVIRFIVRNSSCYWFRLEYEIVLTTTWSSFDQRGNTELNINRICVRVWNEKRAIHSQTEFIHSEDLTKCWCRLRRARARNPHNHNELQTIIIIIMIIIS